LLTLGRTKPYVSLSPFGCAARAFLDSNIVHPKERQPGERRSVAHVARMARRFHAAFSVEQSTFARSSEMTFMPQAF
jgi:hypothetical protein